MAKVSSFTQDYAKKREEQVRENGYERFGTQTYGLRDLAAQVRPAASQRPVTAEASTEPARNQTVRPEFADQGISNSRGDTRILTGEPLNLTREGQWAAKHPIAGTLMYGVSNLVGGAEGLVNTGEAALRALATGQKFNPNNIHAAPIAQGFRTGAAEGFRREAQEEHPRISSALGIDSNDGRYTFGEKAMDFLTGVGADVVSSGISMATGGPVSTALMGGSAANQALYETSQDQNTTARQAVALATANGIAEAFFEHFSIERLMHFQNPTSTAQAVRTALAQAGVEASEEMATEIANTISDIAIRRGNSERGREYQDRLTNGEDPNSAARNTAMSAVTQVLLSGLGGALSGGLHTGMAMYGNTLSNGMDLRRDIQNGITLEDIAGSIDTSTAEGQRVQNLANDIAQREASGTMASDTELGYLRNAIANAAEVAEQNEAKAVASQTTPVEDVASETTPQESIPERQAVTQMMNDVAAETASDTGDAFRFTDYYNSQRMTPGERIFNAEMSQDMASTFGEEGRKAFSALPAEEGVKAYREWAAHYNNMRFGIPLNPNTESRLSPEQISAAMRAGALDANRAYPQDTMKAVNRAVNKIRVNGVNAGNTDLSGIDYKSLTPQQKLRVDYTSTFITKGLGMDVRYVKSEAVDGKYKGMNGSFQVINGRPTMTLDVNAGMNRESDWTGDITDIKTMLPVISHETTHFLEQYNPKLYKELSNTVLAALQNSGSYSKGMTINSIIEAERKRLNDTIRDENGKPVQHTQEDAIHELVARACEDMLSGDQKALDAFNSLDSQTKQTLWDHVKQVFDNIREFFSQMLSSYKSDSAEAKAIRQNMEEFEKIRDLWDEALNGQSAEENADYSTRDLNEYDTSSPNIASDTGVQHSTRITDKSLLKRLNDEVNRGDYITTYKAMQLIDGKLYPPMAAKVKGEDGKYRMQNPSMLKVWQQADEDPAHIKIKNGRGYYVLNKGNGKSIEAAYNPYEHSSNLVLNDQFEEAYKRDNLVFVECRIPKSEIDNPYRAEYAKDSTGVLDWKAGTVAGKLKNNKRQVYLSRYLMPYSILEMDEVARMWKDTLGDSGIEVPFNVVPPKLLTELEKIGVPIDREGSPLYKAHNKPQYSTRDSQGKELTENQQKYFADSKIRDKDGNLMVVYHGTPRGDFTVFDNSKIGSSTDYGWYGKGFYFTDKESAAKYYAGYLRTSRVMKGYLNITNPYELKVPSGESIHRVIADAMGEMYDSAEEQAEAFTGWLKDNGYDGLITKGQYMVFDSNQFKSIDNENPTANSDIRYSTRDSSGDELTEAQAEYFKDSKIRDKKGNLQIMYHGTNGDFNIFDPKKMGGANGTAEGFGIYLSDRTDVSDAYGDRLIKAYVNVTKPATSTKRTITRSALKKLIKATAMNEASKMVADGDYKNVNEAVKDSWISNYTNTYEKSLSGSLDDVVNQMFRMDDNDMGIIQEVMAGMGIRNYEEAYDFYDILKRETGFDGFETWWTNNEKPNDPARIVLAFDSNQVKNTDNLNPTENSDIRYSTRSQEMDAEYQEALEANNEDWQLMLVDQAAYEAGYTTTAYHGSPFTDINVFSTRSQDEKKQAKQLLFGTHFTQNLEYAKIYARKAKNSKGTSRMTTREGKIYKTYLDLGKSLDLRTARNITPGAEEYKLYEDAPAKYRKKYPALTFSKYDTDQGLGSGQFITAATLENVLQAMSPKEATDFLVDHGYNSILYDASYATPTSGNNRMTRDPSIIMLDPERIKSGDPVTHDDNGNVIPLSERFNSENSDIRYSTRDIEEAADSDDRPDVIRQGSDKDIQFSTRIADKNLDNRLRVNMATFFSGTGTVDFALRNIVRHEFAVEYDAKIAAVYRANNGDNIYVDDVRNVNIDSHKGKVEYFHASPVCKSYSKANNDMGEKPLDIETARATANAIRTLQPKVVTVENVARYRNSEAVKIIEEALEGNGYDYDVKVYSATDFGGATIRQRMFIRAVKDGVLPKVDTFEHARSWYSVVEDLIPELPETKLSNYMEERLEPSGIDIDNLDQPVFVLGGEKSGKLTYATADKPAPTLLAKSTEAKILMPDGRVLRATPRVMARIQGLPDDFDLMEKEQGITNAYKIVGNGVPVQLTQGIVGPLLEENLIRQKSEATGVQYSTRDTDYAPTFYSKLQREIQNYKGEKIGTASVESYLKGKGVKDEEIKWSGIRTFLEGKKSVNKAELMQYLKDNEMQIEETVSSGGLSWYDDLNATPFKSKEDAIAAIDDYLEYVNEELTDDEKLTRDDLDIRITDDRVFVKNDYEIVMDARAKYEDTNWSEYKLDGGSNYREVLFSIPNSDYSNQAMRVHWKGKTGVLAHARIQDFETEDGDRVLFVEEIQSDWHNAGQKEGYADNAADEPTKVQDAPYRTTYTDYVLKNLLRMAAEENYDYLAWTTGKMQEERWSDAYAEGYRIEYDQQIPKFLKKYGKQWGAGLTNIPLGAESEGEQRALDRWRESRERFIAENPGPYSPSEQARIDYMNGEIAKKERRVPAIVINDAMKESVLHAGQPMFSQRNVDIDARIDALVKKYGAMPTGEHPQRSEQLPKQTSDGKNLRRFARTVWESGITTDDIDNEIKKAIIDESLSYEVKTDEEAAEYASSVIRIGGVERAQKEWDRARRSDTFNKDHMALGQFLLKEYAKNNDVENAMKMIQELAAEGTRMGQNIQAMRMLKKYSQKVPAIGLGYIQRTVDQMNRDAKRKMGKKFQKMEIDQKLADAYLNAKTQDEIDSAIADIYIDLGSQVQKTTTEDVVDRLRTWRYMAMLGNPRTHIRNLVGNALFVPAVQMKNAIGAGLEGTMKTKTRTKAVRISKEAAAFAKQDALEMKDRLSGRQDLSIRDLIMEQRKVFSSKALNTLSEKNSQALEAEDWIFLRRHYENSLAQYITANKLDTTQENPAWLGKAREYAVLEAQKATYRDANKVSAWLNQSGKAGTVVKYMMEGMLPFKKTPTNILRRGVEYSPAGLVATLTKGTRDLNTGKITVNEWIDGVSAGLTGTAIFGLGMFLASTGAILGGYDDDDDKELRKLKGLQEYSVRIGNKTYTIDWAAPGSLPLFIGVETMSALQSERGVTMDDMGKSVMRMIDPMINMSMLSGLNDTLDAISYSDNKLSAAAMETFYSLLGQYVPTLFGQVARTIDTTQRINYQDKNKGMSKDMLYFIEKMQNKIPFLTFSNDPYLNEFGQENDSGPHWAAALQNFASPGYISSVKDDNVINEIERLQGAQEENVLPKKMPKYLGTKENRVDLTSEQYTLFQRTAGQTAYNILDRMIDDRRYDRMNADEQAAAIKMAYDYAKAVGRIAVQPEYESDLKGDTKKIYNAVKDRKQAFSAILDLCAEKKEKKKSK